MWQWQASGLHWTSSGFWVNGSREAKGCMLGRADIYTPHTLTRHSLTYFHAALHCLGKISPCDFFFLSFYLETISNLTKACKNKNNTKNICISFNQIINVLQHWLYPYICPHTYKHTLKQKKFSEPFEGKLHPLWPFTTKISLCIS